MFHSCFTAVSQKITDQILHDKIVSQLFHKILKKMPHKFLHVHVKILIVKNFNLPLHISIFCMKKKINFLSKKLFHKKIYHQNFVSKKNVSQLI